MIAAALDAHGPAFLLASVDPIGKPVVGDDVVELSGGLVVPTAPSLATIDGERCSLVDTQQDDLGIFRVDPDAVVIVTPRSALDGGPGLSTIHRTVKAGVDGIDPVPVHGVHPDLSEIVTATMDASFFVHQDP